MKPFVCSCLAVLSLSAPRLPLAQEHSFSVKDDIAMVRFSDPTADVNSPVSENAKVSPDGKHVAVVTTRGILDSDQIESTVSIFDLTAIDRFLTDASLSAPAPRVVAYIATYPHREQLDNYAPVIKDLVWSVDSKRTYFRGESPNGAYRLYEANADGSGFRSLTPASEDVDRFDAVRGTIVYTSSRMDADRVSSGKLINSDALAITDYRLMDILFPSQLLSYQPVTLRLSTIDVREQVGMDNSVPGFSVFDTPLALRPFPFRLSPYGDQLITVTPVEEVPEAWANYQPALAFEHRRLRAGDPALTSPDNSLRPRQYSLVNLVTGKTVPLVNGPNALYLGYSLIANTVSWAPDESRILITNVYLPLDRTTGRADSQLTLPCAVASVDLPSLSTECIFFQTHNATYEDPRIDEVAFGRNSDEALVTEKIGATGKLVKRYEFGNGEWRLTSAGTNSSSGHETDAVRPSNRDPEQGTEIVVRQDLNTPPTLWASNRSTAKARQLWDPNPQFAHMRFGEASVYQWKDKEGRDWTGGLVKPVGYLPGTRYPLVIQMYQFRENEFLTDGTDPSAFAARELASAGFVVLQIRKRSSVLSEADPATHLDAYKSAIESLSNAGLIDPSRVGVVGFSWTCWYVINALIKDPGLFAAATIADGLDNSYMQYILFSPGPPNTHEQMDKIRGTSPFGAGLKRWVQDAPGFHLDRVKTPVRIEAINPTSVLEEWELYSSLYLQNKPVDFIYFPHGTHIHQRPLERMESQQGNVDWLRFWLQDYKDPDPVKQFQYERWQKMKSEENQRLSAPAVP